MPVVPAYEVVPTGGTVGVTVVRGITVDAASMPTLGSTVVLGEEGRGRKRVRVPLPEGTAIEPGGIGIRVATAIPVTYEDAVAVILIRDLSGYRGTWDLVEPLTEDEIQAYRETGELPARDPVAPPREIARGRCAQGIAGRMGGGDEILYVAAAGETYDAIRWGRLYGASKVVRITAHPDGSVTVHDPIEAYESRLAASRW